MNEHEIREQLSLKLYYVLIGVVSIIALLFLPMIGTTVGLAWALPTTVVGWIVWVATKLIIAGLNMFIFHCFIQQGKINIKNNPAYQEANEILDKITPQSRTKPRSPHQWMALTYGRKGTFVFLTSVASTAALSQAILTFDWVSMLTYLFTIVMGIVFGIIQMKATEEFWTGEYLEYARYVRDEKTKLSEDNNDYIQQ